MHASCQNRYFTSLNTVCTTCNQRHTDLFTDMQQCTDVFSLKLQLLLADAQFQPLAFESIYILAFCSI